jgi:hypothetical protein
VPALALWNGRDPILKERAFGLTGNQGNRGEDVKEVYFYRDATPSHSWLRYLYKYPQRAFPYQQLVGRERPPRPRRPAVQPDRHRRLRRGLRYWDIEVHYAKATPERIHVPHLRRTTAAPTRHDLHLLPTLWFRNTWSWGDAGGPEARGSPPIDAPAGAGWAVQASTPNSATYYLYGAVACRPAVHRERDQQRAAVGQRQRHPLRQGRLPPHLVDGEPTPSTRPTGTKCAAWSRFEVGPGQHAQLDLVLSAEPLERPFAEVERPVRRAPVRGDVFYDHLLPEAGPANDARILRQALAGMIWTKQFYHYDVARWLDGDQVPPPPSAARAATSTGGISRPATSSPCRTTWEYPWFAAWDLAYHCAALALVDVDFAKDQVELMLSTATCTPTARSRPTNGTSATSTRRCMRWRHSRCSAPSAGAARRGDHGFLQRVFHKLLLNFSWWINRKDADGHNLFEGGFLGLDNISVYDRSKPLPPGYSLKQADATGWMAHFSLKMTLIALELCVEDPDYEDIAIHCYKQFLSIAEAIAGSEETGTPSLWDMGHRLLHGPAGTPDGTAPHRGLLLGRADPAVRGRDRQPAHARACAALRGLAARAQGRPVPRQPSAPARTGRTSAASACWRWWITACCRASWSGCWTRSSSCRATACAA